MGSKNRLSKYLSPVIQTYVDYGCNAYIEPFVGGANMIDKIKCNKKIGYDIDKYVIAVLNGLKNGVEPPKEVSKELYLDVKNNPDNYSDFIVGYIGYELSFGAKWFGGYVKRDDLKHRGDIYSYKSCMKQSANLKNIDFYIKDYFEISNMNHCVIYCDPPYKDSTSYKMKFDYEKFYGWCKSMSTHNTVLISEYSMPNDFECIMEKETKVTFDSNRQKNDDKSLRTERLFICK